GSSVGIRSGLQGRFGDGLDAGRRVRLIGGATWGESVEVGEGVMVQVDARSRFAGAACLGVRAVFTLALVTRVLSMGEGAVIKGGKLPVTLDGEVAVGADAQLVGAVHICDEVEVGESAQIEGPRGGLSDEVATELDAGCEILDRARLHPGARLGAQTVVGSSAEVGTQVVTGAST